MTSWGNKSRGPFLGFAVGVATVVFLGSGVAAAANTSMVQVVNQLLAVSVKNSAADPVPVKVTEQAPSGRTPFQVYVQVPPSGTEIAVVPPGQRLVITYINSRDDDGDFLALVIDGHETFFEWKYRNGQVDSNPLIYVEAGSDVRLFEGSDLDVNPLVAVSGYYEPAP